jgi:dihydroorotase
MGEPEIDLLIEAGRVVCPATGRDGPGAVAVRGDRIVAVGEPVAAQRVFRFPDGILLPGLIDLHAHPAREGSKFGVDPDIAMLPRGVTTVMSQGDAGADNWRRYRETTIEACRTRVRLAINLSRRGETMPGGCFEVADDADVDACIAAIRDGGDLIWGVAANVSAICCGETDPRLMARRALAVAEATGKPLLYGLHEPGKWPYEEQLALLRPGDVVTYCFRREPTPILENGRVIPAVRAARERGILFDVGHGMTSFSFPMAEAAIADGFPPDTISTDGYAKHLGQIPPHDLPRTMAKLRAAGMGEGEVFAAVTARPAQILGLAPEIGQLTVGACADLTVLAWREDAAPLVDVDGVVRPGGCWEAVLTVRGGLIVAGDDAG